MRIAKNEIRLIHPHRYWGFKCGQNVTFNGKQFLFLGYKDKEECVIADWGGTKTIVRLQEIHR